MFDIGFAELLIIGVVALLVLGPDKLPTAIRTLGLWVGKFRRTVSGIQAEISEELRLDEMRRNAAIEKERLDRELAEMQTPFKPEQQSTDAASAGATQAEPASSAGHSDAGGNDSHRNKADS
ncbi:hypothetical protein GCM10011348_06100 [Marinobacterium nitratireducens]|uniref:Sec-independent protein translocase protein TatB n=1 Tax=Marinobacterium nitratireducens TaxID=518897 RepID=A0A917Z781_9GAMM|nr:Sec-independent protein translocase protein TatB [Marinobacterium nitratireducens]GGO77179.1 hypothetical protein GCM10011348_06100 [Marinobacterium nitratireducens]